ncbi:DUF4190 domain-containing protein [Demequina sp.]|uniref:DUF4190 domain-containing protein n=1 Tax=Demequina sp. TaxID=2050685 RepID=UPI0025C6CF70|nr:DUF4190 domain-containing protein [Demequina sp.]
MPDIPHPPAGADQPPPVPAPGASRHGLHPQQTNHSEPLYAALPEPNLANGQATAGMILGLVSLLINTFLIVGMLAIVFSFLGLRNADRFQSVGYGPRGRGAAVTGLVCGIVGTMISLLFKWVFFFLF